MNCYCVLLIKPLPFHEIKNAVFVRTRAGNQVDLIPYCGYMVKLCLTQVVANVARLEVKTYFS